MCRVTPIFYKKIKENKKLVLSYTDTLINEKNKISIQHLLLVGMGKNKSIIKHWRQDWLYQNTHLYEFVGDRVWESINLKKRDL